MWKVIRRILITALLVWVFFLLQSSVFPYLSFGGIVPNLLVVLTASFGFMRGEREGMIIGFACGLLCDIFFGNIIGFYALIMLYIGFLNGKFSGGFYPEDIKLPIILINVSMLSYSFICYIFLFLFRGKTDLLYYMIHVILPEVIYTTIITIVEYPLILVINLRLEKLERKGAQKFV